MKQAVLSLAQLPVSIVEVIWENGVWTEAGSQVKGQSWDPGALEFVEVGCLDDWNARRMPE